jgi:hypothetical protein
MYELRNFLRANEADAARKPHAMVFAADAARRFTAMPATLKNKLRRLRPLDPSTQAAM